jgi:hypothetical protein
VRSSRYRSPAVRIVNETMRVIHLAVLFVDELMIVVLRAMFIWGRVGHRCFVVAHALFDFSPEPVFRTESYLQETSLGTIDVLYRRH